MKLLGAGCSELRDVSLKGERHIGSDRLIIHHSGHVDWLTPKHRTKIRFLIIESGKETNPSPIVPSIPSFVFSSEFYRFHKPKERALSYDP